MLFQILDWQGYDELNDDDEYEYEYKIRLFGKTKEQKTVCIHVDQFEPFFFVEMDKSWKTSQIAKIMERVQQQVYPKANIEGLINYKTIDKCKFAGFSNYKKFNYLQLTFKNLKSMKSYERAFSKPYKIYAIGQGEILFNLYESNIDPFIRLMHIRGINAVGWVSIEKHNLIDHSNNQPTCCELNYKVDWTDLNAVQDTNIEKFVIAAIDIECNSNDGSFPKPEIDEVIEIGMTLSRFGEDECYEKHMLAYKETDKIDDVIMHWYDSEEKMLLAFTKLLRTIDPDIVTGYNTFGFDFDYLKRRSEHLGIYLQFSRLSRVSNEESKWVDKVLQSSALGENKLKYWNMIGRINIDLMKVVQRDHKLTSYKLDDVAANFIRDTILEMVKDKNLNHPNIVRKRDKMVENIMKDNIISTTNTNNTIVIKTKNTYGLSVGQYVCILYNDGIIENKYNDGEKFKILELTKDSITIDAKNGIDINELIDKKYKIYWSQTKDDIKVNDIFRYFRGSSADRAIVAKYCIQDCALCNKLINKLQIITNNVSMANVCHVPLSYLFLRGQGVKISSLVLRKCREENHLVPNSKVYMKNMRENNDKYKKQLSKDEFEQAKRDDRMQKFIGRLNNKNEEFSDSSDDEDEATVGYEGATVFPPKKGAHFEPVIVLDFASLYPNAMTLRNLSHECYVNDPTYDNLVGYKYHTITYKNNDGTETTCKFAENVNGEKGIIPRILMDLLSARKKYKRLMGEEKDPFRRSILDSLQNAYKVTANSLYGQTGSSFSDIYMKEIAASTTATGREMLLYSKHFMESIFTKMIRLALSDKDEYMEYMTEVYTYYPHKVSVNDVSSDGAKIVHNIHVATDTHCKIPDSKFVANSIEYELECELYDGNKKKSDFYEEFKDTFDYDNVDEFNEKFVKTLEKNTVVDRQRFIESIKKKKPIILDGMNIDKSEFKQNIRELTDDKFNKFVKIIDENVSNMGYRNKEEMFEKFYLMVNSILANILINPVVIYGDTDSVFFKMNLINATTKEKILGREALIISITFGIWAGILICASLPPPMQQIYEKILMPFALLSKKRYVGNLYERNPNKYYQKSMGIVLKRRDNAPIVKIVVGGIINQILNKQSAKGALEFTYETLKNIIVGKYKLDKFIISKTLRSDYANRNSIAHAVLADRMGERDAGTKPQSNDRIPYAYIETKNEIKLQGDRIEHESYIIEHGLKIDYLFYITNQIMKPAVQFLELIVHNPEKVFQEYIIKEENRKKCMMPFGYYANDGNCDDYDNMFNDVEPEQVVTVKKTNKRVHKFTQLTNANNTNFNDNDDIKKRNCEIFDDFTQDNAPKTLPFGMISVKKPPMKTNGKKVKKDKPNVPVKSMTLYVDNNKNRMCDIDNNMDELFD